MTFGVLGSIIPQVSLQGPAQKENLYVGIQSSLTLGKVSICNHGFEPARVQLGYYDEGMTARYFEFNRTIWFGETYETPTIHVGENQILFVQTDQNKVSFLFDGHTIADIANTVRSGILTTLISSDKFKKVLYTAPVASQATVSLSVVNLGTLSSKAKIGISTSSGASGFSTSCYLEYDIDLSVDSTYNRPDIKLNEGDSIICSSDFGSTLSFTVHGQLDYRPSNDDLDVQGNVRVTGSIGVGTTANNQDYKLDLLGDSQFIGDVNISNNLIVGGFNAINETGGFNIGVSSNTYDVTPGNIKELNFLGVGNTFFYDSADQRLDIKISGDGNITNDDSLKNVAFLHYGGFEFDDSIRFPQKFHEIFSHEDAAVDIEDGVNVDIDEDCLLVVTDKNTFDTFATEIQKTNFLSATGFRDNIRCVFDFDATLTSAKKVGYVMIPDQFTDEIDCDIEPGCTVSIGDMCVLIVGSFSGAFASDPIKNDLRNPYFLQGGLY